MKTSTPDVLKADLPESMWGKILGATPVVLTVVATMLAGLSSSEMTSAQYQRSLAAQQQSKAGDQWNFFQGKKLRSALQHSTLDVLVSNSGDAAPLAGEAWSSAFRDTPAEKLLGTPDGQRALKALRDGVSPEVPPAPAIDPAVRAALEAMEASKPEGQVAVLLTAVPDDVLENTLRAAQGQALAFDEVINPIGRVVDQLEKQLSRAGSNSTLWRSFIAARLAYNAQRYDTESRLNRTVASLYELQVRKSNVSAERHHRRSQQFFYGMLAAQMGVIISTLAMAAKKRSLLWSVAAGAGAVSIIFAAYVYLYV